MGLIDKTDLYKDSNIEHIIALIEKEGTEKAAKLLGVTRHSLLAKLSSMGVYRRKPYTNKRGEIPRRKNELVDKIAELCGDPPEVWESLSKANKNLLEKLVFHLST